MNLTAEMQAALDKIDTALDDWRAAIERFTTKVISTPSPTDAWKSGWKEALDMCEAHYRGDGICNCIHADSIDCKLRTSGHPYPKRWQALEDLPHAKDGTIYATYEKWLADNAKPVRGTCYNKDCPEKRYHEGIYQVGSWIGHCKGSAGDIGKGTKVCPYIMLDPPKPAIDYERKISDERLDELWQFMDWCNMPDKGQDLFAALTELRELRRRPEEPAKQELSEITEPYDWQPAQHVSSTYSLDDGTKTVVLQFVGKPKPNYAEIMDRLERERK